MEERRAVERNGERKRERGRKTGRQEGWVGTMGQADLLNSNHTNH